MDTDVLSEKMMEMNYSEQILPYIAPDNGLFVAFGATAANTPVDDASPMK